MFKNNIMHHYFFTRNSRHFSGNYATICFTVSTAGFLAIPLVYAKTKKNNPVKHHPKSLTTLLKQHVAKHFESKDAVYKHLQISKYACIKYIHTYMFTYIRER